MLHIWVYNIYGILENETEHALQLQQVNFTCDAYQYKYSTSVFAVPLE